MPTNLVTKFLGSFITNTLAKKIGDRILKRIVDFVETFINGIAI